MTAAPQSIQPTTASERDQIVARLSDLQAKQEAATSWGAAVGAREEEIRSLESRLLRIDSMTAGNQPSSSGSAPVRHALHDLADNIRSKVVQLTHYRDHGCQLDHARVIAEGRIAQANQILHWIDESIAKVSGAPAQGAGGCGEKVVAAVAAKCAEIADRHSYAAAQAILQMFAPTGPSVPSKHEIEIEPLYAVTPSPGARDRRQAYEIVRHIIGHLEGNCGLSFFDVTQGDWDTLTNLVASTVPSTPVAGAWTPDQFWEYVGRLAGEFEADQMRDMMAARWLSIGAPRGSGEWRPIETAPGRIREFAKLRQNTIPRGPVVQLGGSLEDGSLYLFGHHALTHEVQQWIVIPALYCRPMDALSVSSTPRATPACDCGFTADVCATNRCHRKQIASAGLSPVPAGYSKLPDGVVCKCFKMWRAPDGSHWCCLPSPLPSTEGK